MAVFRLTSQPARGDKYRTWDAAYVLGSLSADDRSEFESHLAGCSVCSSSVSELADIPALLSLLDADEVDSLVESSNSHGARAAAPGIVAPLARRQRRQRHLSQAAIAVAACLAAAAIVVGGLTVLRSHSPISPPAQMSGLAMTPVVRSPLTATVTLADRSQSTAVDMRCTYGEERDGEADANDLAMVVVGRDGSHTRLATWLGQDGVTATPAGVVALPIDQIAAVEVVSAESGEVLLSRTF